MSVPLRPTFWINQVTLACRDPSAQASFYQAILGGDVTVDTDGRVARLTPVAIGAPFPTFFRDESADAKPSRLHLDIWTTDALGAAQKRVESAGGKLQAHHQRGSTEWLVFCDPEGNEFCVRSVPDAHYRSTFNWGVE